jgi:membrane protein
MNRTQLYGIFKTAFKDFLEDNAVLRAAALTFFIIIPLPTLLLIVLAVFSASLGEAQALQILVQHIAAVAGPSVADLFGEILASSSSPLTDLWTAIVVIGFSVGGTIGVFAVLRDTMDCIWEVKLPKGQPLWKRARQKIVPFFLVSATGLIVIAWSSATGSVLNAIAGFAVNEFLTFLALETAQIIASFGLALMLLAIIYKLIPEAKVHWQDVALAAVITAIAFTVTNYIFGFYIQTFVVTTVGGAAGALLIILLWIFVLNQIVLYGAEVSRVYALTVGTHSRPQLPQTVQRIIAPLQRAGERLEGTVKEDVVRLDEARGQPDKEIVKEMGHRETILEETPPNPPTEPAELHEPKPGKEQGQVLFSIRYKAPKKRKKDEEKTD